jgi:hypothetical protein
MRSVRHGIERDFAFEHFVSQGLSMQRCCGSFADQQRSWQPGAPRH